MFQPPPAQLLELNAIHRLSTKSGRTTSEQAITFLKFRPRIALGGYFKHEPAERSSKTVFNQVIKTMNEYRLTRNEPFLNPNWSYRLEVKSGYYIKARVRRGDALMQEMFLTTLLDSPASCGNPTIQQKTWSRLRRPVTGLGRLLPQRVGLLDCRVPGS